MTSSFCPAVIVTSPLEATLKFWDVNVSALPVPIDQVEAAAPVKLRAPAEVSASVPDVAVEMVRFPEVLVQADAPPDDRVSVFAPVEMLDAESPESESAPLVAVRLSAPVVWVKPFEAVRSPAKDPVPVPVAEMLPVVVIASPAVDGDNDVPALDQNPTVPLVAQVCPLIHTVPETFGSVHVLSLAVRSSDVIMPLKVAPAVLNGAIWRVSDSAVEEANVALFVVVSVAENAPLD